MTEQTMIQTSITKVISAAEGQDAKAYACSHTLVSPENPLGEVMFTSRRRFGPPGVIRILASGSSSAQSNGRFGRGGPVLAGLPGMYRPLSRWALYAPPPR